MLLMLIRDLFKTLSKSVTRTYLETMGKKNKEILPASVVQLS
uniref:Uncharacterized protein n=1 Tax=Rhizophora mucronata TaxID=61149 RepID=A0A2P2PMD4_RHIMU